MKIILPGHNVNLNCETICLVLVKNVVTKMYGPIKGLFMQMVIFLLFHPVVGLTVN